jgi:hypothetical protein
MYTSLLQSVYHFNPEHVVTSHLLSRGPKRKTLYSTECLKTWRGILFFYNINQQLTARFVLLLNDGASRDLCGIV